MRVFNNMLIKIFYTDTFDFLPSTHLTSRSIPYIYYDHIDTKENIAQLFDIDEKVMHDIILAHINDNNYDNYIHRVVFNSSCDLFLCKKQLENIYIDAKNELINPTKEEIIAAVKQLICGQKDLVQNLFSALNMCSLNDDSDEELSLSESA